MELEVTSSRLLVELEKAIATGNREKTDLLRQV